MKKLIQLSLLAIATLISCNKFDLNYDPSALENKDTQAINENAAKVFGNIDPEQDWNSIKSGTVTVTANANLSDIVKVQILTESPFLNPEAKVLSETAATNNQTVTLSYDAPNAYTQLIAACVNSKGNYYIQVFDANAPKTVSFAHSKARAPHRASASDVPSFTTLKLGKPHKSLNAQRAAQGSSCTISGNSYTEWGNSGWDDDMWELADGNTFNNGWQMDTEKNKGHVYRTISGFAEGEEDNVKAIVNNFLYKTDNQNKKKNNLAAVRNSENFKTNQNYVITDGKNPVTLIPIQAWSTEFKWNHVYYYFFNPNEKPSGMTEAEYIKKLPKFKAIQIERVQSSTEGGAGTFYRRQEFLLPYFKNAPVEGDNEASPIFPAGYKVGFLNAKYDKDYNKWDYDKNGCVYGDGQLNYEVNHLKGHYLSAMDKSIGGQLNGGMSLTDSRIAIFTANDRSYMTFEDGADCTFSDMVFEIGGGIDQIEETYSDDEITGAAYTMCFEDRPLQADYDLNDVVLRCIRVNKNTLQLTLVATGANDDVVIHGATGWRYNDTEVHEAFHATEPANGNRFVNTVKGGTHRDVLSDFVIVPETTSIPQYLKGIYIENKSTGKMVKIAQKGEAPFAIIVPEEFDYPQEFTPITGAYSEFLKWAQDVNSSNNWYKFEDADKIFPSLFKKW
jgi:hypothetical protein